MSHTQQSLFTLPVWIAAESWAGFEEMRKKQRKLLTDRARNCIINTLWRLKETDGQDPNAVLDQSTVNCWIDVYPLRERRANGIQRETKYGRTERAIRAACDELAD